MGRQTHTLLVMYILESWHNGSSISLSFQIPYPLSVADDIVIIDIKGCLIDLFVLEKALYEVNTELNDRPDWVAIPLRGILALLDVK